MLPLGWLWNGGSPTFVPCWQSTEDLNPDSGHSVVPGSIRGVKLTLLVPEFHQGCERGDVWEGKRHYSQSSVTAWGYRGRTRGWSGTDQWAQTAVSTRTGPVSIGH